MQRDSHACLELIFFSKKKKKKKKKRKEKKKKKNIGFITLVLSLDGLFPTVGLLCPSLVLRSGSYYGGGFLVFLPWALVFEVVSELYQGWRETWTKGAMAPPNFFLKKLIYT